MTDLEPGTRRRLSDGTEAVVVSVHTRYRSQKDFNLSVAETYSYFVREEGGEGAGVLVHNGKYTEKERASDTPSWFKKCPLPPGMKSDEATMQALDEHYGGRSWYEGTKSSGFRSEFSKTKKWFDRRGTRCR